MSLLSLLAACVSLLTACGGGAACQPDRCGSGTVCGLAGVCEAEPSTGYEPEQEHGEDAPLEEAYEVSSGAWGTSGGEKGDEVALGGEGGATLYLTFSLPGPDFHTAVLELRPSEDTTYGAVQTVEVRDVTPFESIDVRRLPGARFERHSRQTVWQEHLRFDVSEMARASSGTVFLAIEAHGDSPGWRVATPSALDPSRRPRLIVHSAAVSVEEPE